jgi:hypothetical protein
VELGGSCCSSCAASQLLLNFCRGSGWREGLERGFGETGVGERGLGEIGFSFIRVPEGNTTTTDCKRIPSILSLCEVSQVLPFSEGHSLCHRIDSPP